MSLKSIVLGRNIAFFSSALFVLLTILYTVINLTAPETFRLPSQCITTPCVGGVTQTWVTISSILYFMNVASLVMLLVFQIKLSRLAKIEDTIETPPSEI